MMVKINYFGPLRRITGKKEEDVQLREHAELKDLFKKLKEKYEAEFETYIVSKQVKRKKLH